MVKIKVRPQTVKEEDLCVLVALPEHEIAESFDTTSSDEEIQRRVVGSIHVLLQRLNSDAIRVW